MIFRQIILNKYLFDTNIIINLLRPKEKKEYLALNLWLDELSQREDVVLVMPEISYYEALRGVHYTKLIEPAYKGLDGITKLKHLFEYLPMTTEMWEVAAELWAQRKFLGKDVGKGIDGDTLLGAQGIVAQGTVVTYNIRHFNDRVTACLWNAI